MVFRRFSQKVLLTGAFGQLGQDLMHINHSLYGASNIIATDVVEKPHLIHPQLKVEYLDVTDKSSVQRIFAKYQPNIVYHLAAILSADGEQNPNSVLDINIKGTHNILEQCRQYNSRVFAASTVATFGNQTPRKPGDLEIQRPKTLYGITKLHLELMGEYYHQKFGLDFRSLRIPVVVSQADAGGGSANFTVKMLSDLKNKKETVIPASPDTVMPLIYVKDVHTAIMQLIDADQGRLKKRTYTMASLQVTVEDYVKEVLDYFPGEVRFEPDFRDDIIKSWPDSTDAKGAQEDWGHKLEYNLASMIKRIYENIMSASRNINQAFRFLQYFSQNIRYPIDKKVK